MNMLNLGCGNRFHPKWVNVDFSSIGDGVIAANLAKGIPFPEAHFDVVYHSHVLEHFSRADAVYFLEECWRVLKPGGILRVAVPDLEKIARAYLDALKKVQGGDEIYEANYDWLLLEMYDQTVRNISGGDMARFLMDKDVHNEEFIIKRCGVEIKSLIQAGKDKRQSSVPQATNFSLGSLKSLLRKCCNKYYWYEEAVKFFLGSKDYQALRIGRFRLDGEVHQWMYDNYSLQRLIVKSDFVNVTQMAADESNIDNWVTYNLDTEPDGSTYKPDSIFFEARKP